MAEQNYTMLFSELLDKVHKAKTKEQKVQILRQNNTYALRKFLKAAFDPKLKWVFPEGEVPYTPNDAPAGTEHTVLAQEANKLWHFIVGGDNTLSKTRKETLFIQILEGLHKDEAELMCNIKDKKLHNVYKGLTASVVKDAFGWNDDYVKPE